MDRRTIELRIAGQNYRLASSAPEGEVRRLAQVIEAKVAEVLPRGRPPTSQAVILAAMALAHEVETERERREALERRTRDLLGRMLGRIDEALSLDAETEFESSSD